MVVNLAPFLRLLAGASKKRYRRRCCYLSIWYWFRPNTLSRYNFQFCLPALNLKLCPIPPVNSHLQTLLQLRTPRRLFLLYQTRDPPIRLHPRRIQHFPTRYRRLLLNKSWNPPIHLRPQRRRLFQTSRQVVSSIAPQNSGETNLSLLLQLLQPRPASPELDLTSRADI